MLVQKMDDLPPISSIPKIIGFDTETKDKTDKRMEGFSFSFRQGVNINHYYIPVDHEFTDEESMTYCNIPKEKAYKYLNALLKGRRIIIHNAEFDLEVLDFNGLYIPPLNMVEDTMLIHFVLDTEREHGLKKIMKAEFGITDVVDYKTAKKMGFIRFAQYGSEDSLYDLWLWYKIYPEFKEYTKQFELYRNVEIPFISPMMKMNYYNNSIRLDKPLLKYYMGMMEAEENYVLGLLKEKLGDINFNSPVQLIGALEKVGYTVPMKKRNKRDKEGNVIVTESKSSDADAIEKMRKSQGGIILDVLSDYRSIKKIHGTYVSALWEGIEATDDPDVWVLRGYNFNPIGARTGRLSCSGVTNMQNQPRDPLLMKQTFVGLLYKHKFIKKVPDYATVKFLKPYYNATIKEKNLSDEDIAEVKKMNFTAEKITLLKKLVKDASVDIRALYIAMPGCVLLDFDYSQLELRMMAHLSGDKAMLDAYNNDKDLHQETADGITKITGHKVTRQTAKTINFKMQYGGHYTTFARDLEIPLTLSKQICEGYDKLFAGRKRYVEETHSLARRSHFVQTILGRRTNAHTKGINLEGRTREEFMKKNNAENAVISHTVSGSSADLIKIAMINIDKKYKVPKLKIQVHDELLFEVPENEADKYLPLIKAEMENAMKLKVKIVAEGAKGQNWRQCHG